MAAGMFCEAYVVFPIFPLCAVASAVGMLVIYLRKSSEMDPYIVYAKAAGTGVILAVATV